MIKRAAYLTTAAAAVFLAMTGLAKVMDALSGNGYLSEFDTLMPFFTHEQVLFLAALLEFTVCWLVLNSKSLLIRGAALVWFSSLVTVYKAGLVATHNSAPCSCLGVLSRLLHLSNGDLRLITIAILAAITVIGATSVFAGVAMGKNGGHSLAAAWRRWNGGGQA